MSVNEGVPFLAVKKMNLDHIAIVDHHAHPLLRKQVTEPAGNFRSWFTESTAPEIHAHHVHTTLFFRTAMRWLAEALECDPNEAGRDRGAPGSARSRVDRTALSRSQHRRAAL